MHQKILVPVDGSGPAMLGVSEAVRLARRCGSQLQLVHVVHEPVLTAMSARHIYMDKILSDLRSEGKAILGNAERVVREHALAPESVLLESIGGSAADAIVEQARQWKADLIVMGTHGRRGSRRLALGSDAEQVVRSSPTPVLLIRGEVA